MKFTVFALVGRGAVALSALRSRRTATARTAGSRPTRPTTRTRIMVDVTRVNMLFTVTDKKGRFITDLAKDDFEVIENKKPQTIQEFTAESDLPLRLAILIDTSNSIRDRFKFEQEAAIEFINSVVAPAPGQGHGRELRYLGRAGVRPDRRSRTSWRRPSATCGRAAARRCTTPSIYACRDKLQQDQPRHKFRRAIIMVSDGDDNQSRVTRDQALEMAQKADAVIYCISTNITRIETRRRQGSEYFAQETGGQAFFPVQGRRIWSSRSRTSPTNFGTSTTSSTARSRQADGLYHTVDLKVKSRKDLVVRARKGYYAPKM